MSEGDVVQNQRVSQGNAMRIFGLIIEHGQELHSKSA